MLISNFQGRRFVTTAVLFAAAAMPGCAWLSGYSYVPPGESASGQAGTSAAEKPAARPEAAGLNNDDVYLAEHEGRLYVFDDEQVYASFIRHGETPYRLVRVGAGPNGSTIVFGLRDEDKAKSSGIASVEMYEGRMAGMAEGFYAEVLHDERFYVFSDWQDLVDFQQTREANLRYTEIAAGPGGRTVVYVLNDSNKESRPVAQIERFHRIHN